MRTAITLGRKHGEKHMQVLSGPEKHLTQQFAEFKDFKRVREHAEFEEVELWTSDGGRIKSRSLSLPLTDEEKAAAKAKAEADAEAKAKAEQKAKAKAEAAKAKSNSKTTEGK